MRPATLAAIHRHADRLDADVRIATDETAVYLYDRPIDDGTPRVVAAVHQDADGRWVVAEWHADRAQYTGHSPAGERAMGMSYRYTYARTLAGLRGEGVPSYPTAAAALRTLEGE